MISHKRKAIFVHIPKCGGQSIEDIFLKDAGLTWQTREPLNLRKNDNPKIGPPWLAHLTLKEMVRHSYVSQGIVDEYFVFSVVRDPYKRIESIYKHTGYIEAIAFDEFIKRVVPSEINSEGKMNYFFKPATDYLIDESGLLKVDKVYRLESIEDVIPDLNCLGVDVISVPHVNKELKRSFLRKFFVRLRVAMSGYYTISPFVNKQISWDREMLDTINQFYKKDFENFGYKEK